MLDPEATPPTQELLIDPSRTGRPEPPDPLRRFLAVAAAIRHHQAETAHPSVPRRPGDHALYRRLAELEVSPPTPGDQPR